MANPHHDDASLDSIFASIEPTAVLPQKSGPVVSLAQRVHAKPLFAVKRHKKTRSGELKNIQTVSDALRDEKIDADIYGSDDKSDSHDPS